MPFDDYQKIRELYMGTFGRAFQVYRAADKKYLTLKEFGFSGLEDEERQSALRDANTLTSLKHPYIIRYCEKFIHGSQLCMVFDAYDDGNLWAFIRLCSRQRTFMPEEQVSRWLTQICLAVKYLHERAQPILHGDIQTQNIYLSKKEREGTCAKLFVDFGPMRVLDNPGTCVRAPVGTHFCQCPEICNRMPYGTPADVWSIGCVLYEMCSAHMGWEAEDMADHMENIMYAPLLHIRGWYSPELASIGGEMLSHEAAQRPTADALLKNPLLQAEMKKMLDGRRRSSNQEMEPQCFAAQARAKRVRETSARAEPRDIRDEASLGMERLSQRDALYSARDNAYTSREALYSARGNAGAPKDDARSGAPVAPVRPLGDHNPRMPRTTRSASPFEAAKLLLRANSPSVRPPVSARTPNSPRVRSRAPSRSASPDPSQEVAEALARLLLGAPA